MDGLNKVFLMGNLGSDPKVMTDKQGRPYTKLNIATNRSWQKEGGERESRVDWHDIFVFGKSGETCSKYLKKGAPLFVEGRMSVVDSEDEEKGHQRHSFISAESVKFLPFRRSEESN